MLAGIGSPWLALWSVDIGSRGREDRPLERELHLSRQTVRKAAAGRTMGRWSECVCPHAGSACAGRGAPSRSDGGDAEK